METIFDKILAGELPCEKVFEDQDVLAFRDINPQAPEHVLVIPKQKVTGVEQLESQSTEYVGVLFKRAAQVARLLKLDDGYRIVVNHGDHGGQEVAYLHIHILGRRAMRWPPG